MLETALASVLCVETVMVWSLEWRIAEVGAMDVKTPPQCMQSDKISDKISDPREYDETTWSALTFVRQRISVAVALASSHEIAQALVMSVATDPRGAGWVSADSECGVSLGREGPRL